MSPHDTSSASPTLTITGARILTESGFEDGVVRIEDGLITEITGSEGARQGERIDGHGCLLLPGIVDLHGDAFERSLNPRPGVRFAPELGFDEADRLMTAFGITTALHGLTCSWEPGLRGTESFAAMARALRDLKPRLRCDTHIHLRFEIHTHDGVGTALPLIEDGTVRVLAFNDHLEATEKDMAIPERADLYPARTGVDLDVFKALLSEVRKSASRIDQTVSILADAANRAGVALLSHDDPDLETRAHYRALGARIAEFPLTRDVAANAREHGEHVVMGAPNALRGRSHKATNPSASDMISAGLCSVLSTDYYYPAPLHAAFRLARDGVLPLEKAWELVSAHPAEALGFTDRGRIEKGLRADLVLVDAGADMTASPEVMATVAAGTPVFQTARRR
ncbi:alpha-D-ribose 1-methylphosphonate 5-triphosphate diphosphatase [Cucumibacter marinus]|uniref:alpha-D-ribose 1-methylphosphonate 5-triphosphate diphosphatase n=1 Tax=Cucumibacter marinus TaxID=1121252 RepID=UPI00041B47FA|nr:alpha-D-ribose 1-methylphosphonate 5-triphosphate diphosphatase [Cucumibacter marinus]